MAMIALSLKDIIQVEGHVLCLLHCLSVLGVLGVVAVVVVSYYQWSGDVRDTNGKLPVDLIQSGQPPLCTSSSRLKVKCQTPMIDHSIKYACRILNGYILKFA